MTSPPPAVCPDGTPHAWRLEPARPYPALTPGVCVRCQATREFVCWQLVRDGQPVDVADPDANTLHQQPRRRRGRSTRGQSGRWE